MKKAITLLITFMLACITMSVTAFADTGPKPSTIVNFENLSDEECYATLLSSHRGSGPYSAWEGEEPPEGIDGAFAGYKDKDGYYYLMHYFKVSEKKSLTWGYYPPPDFKILLYYPAHDLFLVSEKCSVYAFDSYFSIDMTGISPDNKALSEVTLTVSAEYSYLREFIGFALRIIITLFIEIYFATKFLNKRRFLIILITNLVTQLGLNLALNLLLINKDILTYLICYIGLELAIGVIETVVYLIAFNRGEAEKVSVSTIIFYTLAANFLSFMAGVFIAFIYKLVFDMLGMDLISPII